MLGLCESLNGIINTILIIYIFEISLDNSSIHSQSPVN